MIVAATKISKEDKAKESILHMVFSYVKRVKSNRYIVEADGQYGVITLEQGAIIPIQYTKITNSEHYFRTYGEIVGSYGNWQGTYDVRENGLFNMDGQEIVPLGNYAKTNALKGFGIALFNTDERITVIASNSEKVRIDLKGDKLVDIGVPGYAALIGYHHGNAEELTVSGRKVKALLDLDLNIYTDLNHLYDKLEEVEENLMKATKETKYTYVNKFGIPTTTNWYINE